jgi:hypothetical protein
MNLEVTKEKNYATYDLHFLAVVPWIMKRLDDPKIEKKVNHLCSRVSSMGAKRLAHFCFNGSPAKSEAYIFHQIPWKLYREDGQWKVDFHGYNEDWFLSLELLEDCCKRNGIHQLPWGLMARYNEWLFDIKNNKQKIHGMLSDDAFPVIEDYYKRIIKSIKSRRNLETYQPNLGAINELSHNGDHKYGLKIANWHLALWRALEKQGISIENFWVDHSHSEYVHAQLVDYHWDPWNNAWIGSDEFKTRKIKSQDHGVSTLKSLYESGFMTGLSSAWPHLCVNEDGANDGSYKIPGLHSYWQANRKELMNMLRFGIGKSLEKNKKFYFTGFVMDSLKVNPETGFVEECLDDMKRINWARLRAYPDVMKREFGIT